MALLLLVLPIAGDVRNFLVDDTQYADIIKRHAKLNNIDEELIRAVIFEESKFNPRSRGKAGEIGLMQLLPRASVIDWAKAHKQKVRTNYELFDPELNIAIGSWYLKKVMQRYSKYDDKIELTLCAYNAGYRNADKYAKLAKENPKGVVENIDIPSTKKYVKSIMKRYRKYKNSASN